jgi:hypothetical protein
MVIGAFVRGLSMGDIESLCEKEGLVKDPWRHASRSARRESAVDPGASEG